MGQAKGSASFLKKRSKKLLSWGLGRGHGVSGLDGGPCVKILISFFVSARRAQLQLTKVFGAGIDKPLKAYLSYGYVSAQKSASC
jgi:hypothetical protein